MKLGYYLVNIRTSDGGIYQYSIYVLKMLLKCVEIEQIVIFHSKGQEIEFRHLFDHPKVKTVLYDKNSRINKLMKKTSDFYLTRYYLKRKTRKHLLNLYKFLNPDRRFLNRFDIDLLHVPRQHSPAYRLKYPVIVTMHDVQHFHFPEFFTPIERIYKSISYYTSLSETDHTIVSYNHIKTDLIKYFPVASDKVTVCPVPIDEDWVSDIPGTGIEELKSKYHLPDQIILTPAATWEHKNHIAVLEAMSILKKEGFRVFWVATGHKTPYYARIEEKINELDLRDQVCFPGIVSDADLKGLYKLARLVVIPTRYEAGSGPLIEAMRYGTPVICSNVTSLPDTIDNPAFLFKTTDHPEIAGIIKYGLTDPDFINENLANSARRVLQMKNQNYTSAFMHAYKKAVVDFSAGKGTK